MFIYNAKILTMKADNVIENGYVEIENGKIVSLGEGNPEYITDSDIDAEGKTLLPGFIDSHTHLGIIENGIDFEGDDCNESTDPFSPQLRAIDGINPFDFCFEEARKRGITTAVVSPGSANACGGSIVAIKTAGNWIDRMVVKTVAMKFALGENPKTVYNDRDETPVTRMGTVSIIREGLYKAKRYLDDIQKAEEDEDEALPEYDAKCEALVPLLNGEIEAHFHCHRADDIQTAIRISREFHLKCVIIHGTEGYKIADGLGYYDVPVIAGPILCDRCKPEMKDLDLKNAGILWKNGVKVALCTDHTVIPIQYLPLSAALAVKGGMPYNAALRAITSDAAQILGIDDKVGSIAVGLDADLQLYSGDPLGLDDPCLVMVKGEIV